MAFGARRRNDELEAENASLKQWVAHLGGTEAVMLAREVQAARNELAQAQAQLAAARAGTEQARREAAAERAAIVETRETAMLQEVGIYHYRHPLETALAYRQRLDEVRRQVTGLVTTGEAVNAAVGWTVNNSRTQGERMVRDLKKLMLRAYNAEADNAVRTLKPHTLGRAVERLTKSRETIARLGRIMSIRVSDQYHQLRVHELELTADHLTKVEEEKERVRAERERQREEEKARREFEAARAALRKEQAHYEAAMAKAVAGGDTDAVEMLRGRLAEIGTAVQDVESRAANVRAGYVYVISNIGAFGERMVKVGMTRRLEPTDRIRELGDASVPFRFDTHALIFSEDAVGLENRLHQELADRRVNRVNTQREFFYATATEVRDILAKVGTPDLLLEFTETAEALEWRASCGQPVGTPAPAGAGTRPPGDGGPDGPGGPRTEPTGERGPAAGGGVDGSADTAGGTGTSGAPGSGAGDLPEGTGPGAGPEGVSAPRPTAEPDPAPTLPPQHRPAGPGWYPDPWRATRLRWWDGARWTSHTSV